MQQMLINQDLNYQGRILQGVSRTFALTIPQLPEGLRTVVGNAYLLCRIADTIEDEATLPASQKRYFSNRFIGVVEGSESANAFAVDLYPLLSDQTLEAERDLIRNTASIIRITESFNDTQKKALARCVRIMAKGMADYQDKETLNGLTDQAAMDDYCYYVAGVVGEMLTSLFCDFSEDINAHHDELMKLSRSFGQGLQMTNILKDIWDDRTRGACWLPQKTFAIYGFDLADLKPGDQNTGFQQGLSDLIAIAHRHLSNALKYTLLIPAHHKGIRKFCLWAIGMAILTLNKINKNRNFSNGTQVKISRRSVKATILITNMLESHDKLLNLLFNSISYGLPAELNHEKIPRLERDEMAAKTRKN